MNYDDIKDMTNEEAVAYYSPLTNSYVPCSDLENILGWAGLAKRNAVTSAWEGSLIDFMGSNAVPSLSDGLSELFSHLNKPRSTGVDTFEQPWGGSMADLLGGLEAVGQVDASFTAAVYNLAEGYAYPDLDVDAVQAIRDEEAERIAAAEAWAIEEAARAEAWAIEEAARAEFDVKMQRYNELYNIHISPLATDENADDAAWAAALQAMSDEFVVAE